jgi:hypothetical protein
MLRRKVDGRKRICLVFVEGYGVQFVCGVRRNFCRIGTPGRKSRQGRQRYKGNGNVKNAGWQPALRAARCAAAPYNRAGGTPAVR